MVLLNAFCLQTDTDECLDTPGKLGIDPIDAGLHMGSDDSSYLTKARLARLFSRERLMC